jgi:hypothetical protein
MFSNVAAVRKRVFLRCHLYIKMIFLPRQARDKHREKHSKKGYAFLHAGGRVYVC